MDGEVSKSRVKGRFMAAFNKVLFRCRRRCQISAPAFKPGGSRHRSSRLLAESRQGSFSSDGTESVFYHGIVDSNVSSATSSREQGDSIARGGGEQLQNAESRDRDASEMGHPSGPAVESRQSLPGQASQAIVQRYVARARDHGASQPAGGAPQIESSSSRGPLSLAEGAPGAVPLVEASLPAEQPTQEASPESTLACPPSNSFPKPLPGKDLNVLLCTVATHMWIAESLSELEMLGEMVDVLVRGGASEFLPAIIKGCWAASLSRSGVNLPQKVALFSKMVREGARLLSPDELHEALRVASMACACVWADREKGVRAGGGCPVRALLEVIRVLIRAGASNVNRVMRDVISYKIDSVEVVRVFLREDAASIDVNRALRHATACSSHVNVLRCLIREGGAWELSRPLMLAAINGFLPAVKLFLEHGCTDSGSLYGALYCAVTAGQCELIEFLLGVLPPELGHDDRFELLKSAAADESALQGVIHLLRCNVMESEPLTIAAADSLASRESTRSELRAVLQEHWTSESYERGRQEGRQHGLHFAMVADRGTSGLRLRELPVELQVAIAYRGLFERCSKARGAILPPRLKGELVTAVDGLTSGERYGGDEVRWMPQEDLVGHLRRRLPRHVHG